MKAQITKVNNYWRLTYYKPDKNNGLMAANIFFPYAEGAFHTWRNIEYQLIMEQKAYAKVIALNRVFLNVHEDKFITKLQKCSCIGITKRQYGYLSGILERQNGI